MSPIQRLSVFKSRSHRWRRHPTLHLARFDDETRAWHLLCRRPAPSALGRLGNLPNGDFVGWEQMGFVPMCKKCSDI